MKNVTFIDKAIDKAEAKKLIFLKEYLIEGPETAWDSLLNCIYAFRNCKKEILNVKELTTITEIQSKLSPYLNLNLGVDLDRYIYYYVFINYGGYKPSKNLYLNLNLTDFKNNTEYEHNTV